MTTATDRSVHILRRSSEIFAWPLSNALHHARMGRDGMTSQQAEKIENFLHSLPPDDMPRLDALLDQFRVDYSRRHAHELIEVMEEIADGHRHMTALSDSPNAAGENRRLLNTPLYAWTVEDILQNAEVAEEDPDGSATWIRRFVEQISDNQKPALLRFLADAVDEHREELSNVNRRMGETVLGYLEMATKNGKIPNAYH